MNGMDKFLNGRDLLLFRWFGKDRTEQFGVYFGKADLPEGWINSVLYVVGTWEIALSLLFLAAVFYRVRRGGEQNLWNAALPGFFVATLTFTAFSVFDVIAGDRGELLEHSIYLGMIILSWFVIMYRRDRVAESALSSAESEGLAAHPIQSGRRLNEALAIAANRPPDSAVSNGKTRYGDADDGSEEQMMDQARGIALHHPYISSGYISCQFKTGEGQANRVIEVLEEEGLVIPKNRRSRVVGRL